MDNGPCVVSCRSTFVCAVVMQLSVLCKQLDLLNAESEQTKAEQDHKAVVGSSQLSVFAVVSVGESVWVFRWRGHVRGSCVILTKLSGKVRTRAHIMMMRRTSS